MWEQERIIVKMEEITEHLYVNWNYPEVVKNENAGEWKDNY